MKYRISKKGPFFLDVDGTLVPDRQTKISDSFVELIKKLSCENRVILCSNGSSLPKIERLAGVECVKSNKPFIKNVLNRVKDIKNPLVIGDKYLTDGLFAHFLNADFIKVDHFRAESDKLLIRLTYFLDDQIWKIAPYVLSLRPWQWIKNLLVFAPIFFAGTALNLTNLSTSLLVFIVFCVVSSSIYVWNDIKDIEADRAHPEKRRRPIASNILTVKSAYLFEAVLITLSVALLYFVPDAAPIIVVYALLNIGYTHYLKRVAVLDVVVVSVFYLLRIYAGGVATSTYISPWIVVCTFFGALFVISGKRRAEFARVKKRKVLEEYSEKTLDYIIIISAALALMSYAIYSILGHDLPNLVYSTVFVVIALFRVLNRIYMMPHEAESPEIMVFKDRWTFGIFALWLACVFVVFYMS